MVRSSGRSSIFVNPLSVSLFSMSRLNGAPISMRIAPAEPPQLGAAAAPAPVPCAGCSAQGSAWGHGSPTLGSFSTEASKSTLFTLRRCFLYEASCLWAETGSSSLDSALLPPRLLLPAVVQSAPFCPASLHGRQPASQCRPPSIQPDSRKHTHSQLLSWGGEGRSQQQKYSLQPRGRTRILPPHTSCVLLRRGAARVLLLLCSCSQCGFLNYISPSSYGTGQHSTGQDGTCR